MDCWHFFSVRTGSPTASGGHKCLLLGDPFCVSTLRPGAGSEAKPWLVGLLGGFGTEQLVFECLKTGRAQNSMVSKSNSVSLGTAALRRSGPFLVLGAQNLEPGQLFRRHVSLWKGEDGAPCLSPQTEWGMWLSLHPSKEGKLSACSV